MDATPLSLGQEFSGYVQQIDNSMRAIKNALAAVSANWLSGGNSWSEQGIGTHRKDMMY